MSRRLLKSVFPAGGCVVIGYWMLKYGGVLFQGGWLSVSVRLFYTVLFAYAMEYVARYNHRYLWHSSQLWWLHGTHHHQYPKVGTPPLYGHMNRFVTPTIELNDLFPLAFAFIAVALISYGAQTPSYLAKDCWTGAAMGTTVFGLSYFTGHDIVAHERFGKRVALFLRSRWKYLDECAAVHFKYHHKMKKQPGDPYGPPYGFWLGPAEVQAMKDGLRDYAPMPPRIAFVLKSSLAVAFVATFIRWASNHGHLLSKHLASLLDRQDDAVFGR